MDLKRISCLKNGFFYYVKKLRLPKGENKSELPTRGHGFGPGMDLNGLTVTDCKMCSFGAFSPHRSNLQIDVYIIYNFFQILK